jgi:hypothetical protein
MRSPKILLPVLFSLAFAAWATSVDAACHANFSGNCSRPGFTGGASCVFDGNRIGSNNTDASPTTCGSSTVASVFWSFDYPNDSGTWDDLSAGTYYSDPAALGNDAVVKMTLICADGCSDDVSRYVLFVNIGCPGCIGMNNGWM